MQYPSLVLTVWPLEGRCAPLIPAMQFMERRPASPTMVKPALARPRSQCSRPPHLSCRVAVPPSAPGCAARV
eukprot:8691182-Alexandrium_andersonii.AAC.1